ncbi:MAG: HEAT repeat domain-containing protein [Planctomycetota bacterium]
MRLLVFLLSAAAGFAGAFWWPAEQETTAPAADWQPLPDRWVAAAECQECHPDIYASWSTTAHGRTIREFEPEMSAVPFDGGTFWARDIKHKMGPGAEMECEGPDGDRATYPVDMVIGVRRVQMFTTRFPDGKIQVLPVFTEVPAKKWFDYADFIFGGPGDFDIEIDGPNSWYLFARNFNSRCGRCHMTPYEVNYDPDEGSYDTKWIEPVVGCDSCHGPGGAHIDHHKQKLPGPDPITNPAKLTIDVANQACAKCHSENDEIVPGFRPGDELFAYFDVHGLEDDAHLYPDGRAKELIHAFMQHEQSPCSAMKCTTCHDPHGSGKLGDLIEYPPGHARAPPYGELIMCTQCHTKISRNIPAHTKHKYPGPGSDCVACHMPRMLIEGGHGKVYDHTISIPSTTNTRRHLSPNACRSCHTTEDPTILDEKFQAWWPDADEKNHRVAMADTVAAGRAGKPEALPKLLAMAKDPNPVYRAGAVWMLSRYEQVDVTEWLIEEHPLVRRAAIRGTSLRAPKKLVPLLADENRVLRRAAALELSKKYELFREDPELAERVLHVMRSFAHLTPDHAKLHGAIGGLEEYLGKTEEAILAYERYLRLVPWNDKIRGHVQDLKKRKR